MGLGGSIFNSTVQSLAGLSSILRGRGGSDGEVDLVYSGEDEQYQKKKKANEQAIQEAEFDKKRKSILQGVGRTTSSILGGGLY
jgi:hypothetical protein